MHSSRLNSLVGILVDLPDSFPRCELTAAVGTKLRAGNAKRSVWRWAVRSQCLVCSNLAVAKTLPLPWPLHCRSWLRHCLCLRHCSASQWPTSWCRSRSSSHPPSSTKLSAHGRWSSPRCALRQHCRSFPALLLPLLPKTDAFPCTSAAVAAKD